MQPGKFLEKKLDEFSISRAEFARHINMSCQYVYDVCNGKRSVSINFSCAAGAALGLKPLHLYNMQAEVEADSVDVSNVKRLKKKRK